MNGPTSPAGADWVFMDLDSTFAACSTEPVMTLALWRKGWFTTMELAKVGLSYARYKLDLLPDMPAAKRIAVRHMLAGKPVAGLTESVDACFRRDLAHRVRGNLVRELKEHRRAGRRIALLTSTLDLIASPFHVHFGFDRLIAARLETVDGHYTGEVLGEFPYGQAKARAARDLAATEGAELMRCIAYGDRHNDRFLMEEVGTAVAVCPDRKLHAIARARGWRIDQDR